MFLRGHRRGVRSLSHCLSYLTDQQLLQGAKHKTYVDVICIGFPWPSDERDFFPVSEPSGRHSIWVNGPERQGNDGEEMAGYAWESRSSRVRLLKTFLVLQ
jgi:hypothetical protein